MAEGSLPSRRWLAVLAFVGHTPGIKLLVRCRFTPRLVRVNLVAAGLTVVAMIVAGIVAAPGHRGFAVLVAWLFGHFAWSVIFSGWILRGGAIEDGPR